MLCTLKSSKWKPESANSHSSRLLLHHPMAERKMRIAVAGTNALALMIATYITACTSHQIIVLSRFEQEQLANEKYQVLVVDYESEASLQHAVMGVHTIISTVTGSPQMALIQAAIAQGVRRFAPAEFEGPLSRRPVSDPLDRGKKTVRDWLQHYQGRMQYTVFTCGVLMERFAPDGLHAFRLGMTREYGEEGDYIVNVRNLKAIAPFKDTQGNEVKLCLTAAQDVAKLIVKAIDMRQWPPELSMVGEKLTVRELLHKVLSARGRHALHSAGSRSPSPHELVQELHEAIRIMDEYQQVQIHELLATINGRYLIHGNGTLRELNPDHQMIDFETFLNHHWAQHPVVDD